MTQLSFRIASRTSHLINYIGIWKWKLCHCKFTMIMYLPENYETWGSINVDYKTTVYSNRTIPPRIRRRWECTPTNHDKDNVCNHVRCVSFTPACTQEDCYPQIVHTLSRKKGPYTLNSGVFRSSCNSWRKTVNIQIEDTVLFWKRYYQ